jgi:hypothetical protein
MPDVVLITQRDQIPAARLHRAEEIVGPTDTLVIAHDHHVEGGAIGKRLHYFDRTVGRRVIGYNKLIRGTRLLRDARKLVLNEPLAIPRGHSDRDPHYGCPIPVTVACASLNLLPSQMGPEPCKSLSRDPLGDLAPISKMSSRGARPAGAPGACRCVA